MKKFKQEIQIKKYTKQKRKILKYITDIVGLNIYGDQIYISVKSKLRIDT